MTEERTGYTTQDVRTLTSAQLVEATNQANYNAGFCVGHNDRQNVDTWIEAAANLSAEITRRLAQAERLAEAAKPFAEKFRAELGKPTHLTWEDWQELEAALADWQAPAGQGKEE